MSDDFSQGPFGSGPFPEPGGILNPEPTPLMSGFGGVDPGGVGAPYGIGAYGSVEISPENPPTSGGFGGSEYGFGPYGNVVVGSGGVLRVVSLDGFTIRVEFVTGIIANAAAVNIGSYAISPTLGAACVIEGVAPSAEVDGSYSYVDIQHSGTTWGGQYLVGITQVHTTEGDPISAVVPVLTLGSAPAYTVTPHSDGRGVRLTFSRALLAVAEEVDDSTGSTFTGSYSLRATSYPIHPSVDSVTRVSDTVVDLQTTGQTETQYTCVVSPSFFVQYDPSEDEEIPDLLGVGTATRAGNSLILSRAAGSLDFGAVFFDASGGLLDASTFAVFVKVQPGTLSPVPVNGSAGMLIVEDDTYQITVSLECGSPAFLRVDGGSYSSAIAFDWTGVLSFELGILRNQKAGIYSVLIDGYPYASTVIGTVDSPASSLGAPGIAFVLGGGAWASSNWRVLYARATVSSTVYSTAWNFYHEEEATFTGSAAFARDSFLTEHGPLVRPWGDGRPARVEDVHVYLNGDEVAVADVNPYIGRITLATPIPRMPPGDLQVTVDYTWQCAPTFPLVAGVEGSVAGGQSGVYDFIHMDEAGVEGTVEETRFPLFVVSGDDGTLPQPVLIAKRFLAWEQAYSALAGDPLSLNAGVPDFSVSVPEIQAPQASQNGKFDGTSGSPPSAQGWALVGSDSGLFASPLYELGDEAGGPYEGTEAPFALYYRELDAGLDGAFYAAAKLQSPVSGERDGVFTGAAWGIHNGFRALVIGQISLDGHDVLAYLSSPENPGNEASWGVISAQVARATTSSSLLLSGNQTPAGLLVGDTLLIRDGAQAGQYTITSVHTRVCCDTREVTLQIEPSLPYRVDTQQGATPTVIFPQRSSTDPVIVRIAGRSDLSAVSVVLGGAQYGTELSLTRDDLPTPVRWAENLPGSPSVFFGALSKQGTLQLPVESVQYTTTPDRVFRTGRGVVVEWLAGELPENNEPALHPAGLAGNVSLDFFNNLLLEQMGVVRRLGYYRPEPFLNHTSKIEVRSTLSVESPCVGGGFLQFSNDQRQVRLAALTLQEVSGVRRLVQVPRVSFDALLPPQLQGWEGSGGDRYEATLTLSDGDFYSGDLQGGQHYTSPGGLRCVFDLEVLGSAAPGEIGSVEWSGRRVILSLLSPNVLRLSNPSGSFTHSYTLAWSGTGRHQITLRADESADAVTVLVDDVLASPALAASSFNGGVGGSDVRFGCGGTGASVRWYFAHATGLEPTGSVRTLGIAKSGDLTDLDNWEVPRTDSSTSANSVLDGPVITSMDWGSQMQLRLILDPSWGVSLFRPDLPLPPYYVPGQELPYSGFVNLTQEPSAAWINVEMFDLPPVTQSFGEAGFYADGGKVRIHAYNHRIFDHPNNDYRAGQHQVAGYGNLIDGGDVARHISPLFVDVTLASPTTLVVSTTDIYADDVFTLQDGEVVYHQDDLTFERSTQLVTLLPHPDGTERAFTSPSVTVQVRPSTQLLTRTLLETLPAWSGNNLLFEGTPAYFEDFGIGLEVSEWTSPSLEVPEALPPANALFPPLADPYKTLLVEGTGSLSFTESVSATNEGVENALQSFCDGCGSGGFTLEAEGLHFSEFFAPPQEFSEYPFNPFGGAGTFLFASGGSYAAPTYDITGDPDGGWEPLGGVIGPGGAVITPLGAGLGSIQTIDLSGVLSGGATVALEETLPSASAGATAEVLDPTAASRLGPHTGTLFYSLEREGAVVRVLVNSPILGDSVVITVEGTPTTFTAVATKTSAAEFEIAVDAAESLASAIRETLGNSGFFAESVTLPAHPYPVVQVSYYAQIDVYDQTSLHTSNPTRLRALGVRTEDDGMFIGSRGGLQGSVLAGGYSGLDFGGGFDSALCFVAEGGRDLPDGVAWISF